MSSVNRGRSGVIWSDPTGANQVPFIQVDDPDTTGQEREIVLEIQTRTPSFTILNNGTVLTVQRSGPALESQAQTMSFVVQDRTPALEVVMN